MELSQVAEGVLAGVDDDGMEISIALVYSQRPGKGNVGRWLDSLPQDRTIVVPLILSKVLGGMLSRRGFKEEIRWNGDIGEEIDCFVRYQDVQKRAPGTAN